MKRRTATPEAPKLPIAKSDYALMLGSALRYALGRRTYIVAATCRAIKGSRELLDDRFVEVAIRDIEEFGDRPCIGLNPYGDECDREEWLALLEWLKELKAEMEAKRHATH